MSELLSPALSAQPPALVPTGMTTPDPVTLQAAFRSFVDAGVTACAIEATSIGLAEHRLAGTAIDIALLTNVTQDHLDYHGAMPAYWQAKAQLFAWPGLRAAVVNIDDAHGAALASTLAGVSTAGNPTATATSTGTRPDLWTYSAAAAATVPSARLHARDVRYESGGLCFELHEGSERVDVRTGLIGDYNVANLLAVIGGLRACGVSLTDAARACARLTPVPGRMQRVCGDGSGDHDGPQVVVDYAHTPDALDKALRSLQPLAARRGGALWCVFGCGGNRDAGKRPLMGAIAQRLAQRVVVTSDNPRNEAPALIVQQIVAGLAGDRQRVDVIEDRARAIAHAVRSADACDVVLIAGKGHEPYQEIVGVRHPFSDAGQARAALAQRPKSPLFEAAPSDAERRAAGPVEAAHPRFEHCDEGLRTAGHQAVGHLPTGRREGAPR